MGLARVAAVGAFVLPLVLLVGISPFSSVYVLVNPVLLLGLLVMVATMDPSRRQPTRRSLLGALALVIVSLPSSAALFDLLDDVDGTFARVMAGPGIYQALIPLLVAYGLALVISNLVRTRTELVTVPSGSE